LASAPKKKKIDDQFSIFNSFKENILNTDVIHFIENNLTLDGKPFSLTASGYKPFVDIYRYIALKAIEPNSKPIVLVKGRQVGATTMASALECYFMACGLYGNNNRPPMRIGHLFPTLAMAAIYTKTKLNTMISQSKPMPGVLKSNGMLKTFMESKIDSSNPSNDSLFFKLFQGGNQLFIESTGIDGGRLRGRTGDACFFDEVQDINNIAIGTVNKILAQSHYGKVGSGIQVYFGTPKQKGSSYYNMWMASQQHYYHLRCEKCNELFPLYRPDVNWEEIWKYGFTVECTHCHHDQDKRDAAQNGKWLPIKGTEEDSKYIGYHINQLYMPTYTKETILEYKPERNPNNTERIYQNEVLGEFYSGEGGLLSAEQVYEICGDEGRPFTSGISPHDKKRVYAGFDWGQKGDLDQLRGHQRGQSYSCGVILTAETPGRFVVEYGMKLKKNDHEYKLEAIEELYRRYSILLGVGDIGDAYDLTHVLQRKYGDRFLASRAVAKVNSHIRYNKDVFPKEILFERDYYYSELFGLLKSGAIRFPMGAYEQIAEMVQHCCSMDIKVGMSRQGDPVRKYVKGVTPNDFFSALLNAYLAYKFHITQGFNIKQPQFMKYDVAQKKRQIPAILGHMPRWR